MPPRIFFWPLVICMALCCVGVGSTRGAAQSHLITPSRRVALVIGNGSYKYTPPLDNPSLDAVRMTETLGALGFEVEKVVDGDKAAMDLAIKRFLGKSEGALALFYYSGHGIQVGDQNYLIPIDAQLSTEASINFETVALQNVLDGLREGARVGLVFLDACRDNPLAGKMQGKRSKGARKRGLSVVEVADGDLLVAYATTPGMTAEDGEKGKNSPFTRALLAQLAVPQEIQAAMSRVTRSVLDDTSRKQRPWVQASLDGDLFLKEAPAAVRPIPPAEATQTPSVRAAAPLPRILSFQTLPALLIKGRKGALSWTTQDATACALDNDIGDVAAAGRKEVDPDETTTYQLTCRGPGGSTQRAQLVTVVEPLEIRRFSASPGRTRARSQVRLSWFSRGATRCSIDNEVGSVEASGSRVVTPESSTTYTLSCEGAGEQQLSKGSPCR